MIGTANEGKDQIKWNEMGFYLAFPSAAYPIQRYCKRGERPIKWNEMKFYLAFPSAAYLI